MTKQKSVEEIVEEYIPDRTFSSSDSFGIFLKITNGELVQLLQTERQRCEEMVKEARRDKDRLDFLDRCNLALNDHYQTNYGWKLILNHNVTRLMSERGLDFIDLHDAEGGNKKFKSCREAIDEALTHPNNNK